MSIVWQQIGIHPQIEFASPKAIHLPNLELRETATQQQSQVTWSLVIQSLLAGFLYNSAELHQLSVEVPLAEKKIFSESGHGSNQLSGFG